MRAEAAGADLTRSAPAGSGSTQLVALGTRAGLAGWTPAERRCELRPVPGRPLGVRLAARDLVHVVRRSGSRLVPLLATAIVAQLGSGGAAGCRRRRGGTSWRAVADEAVAPAPADAGPACRGVRRIGPGSLVEMLDRRGAAAGRAVGHARAGAAAAAAVDVGPERPFRSRPTSDGSERAGAQPDPDPAGQGGGDRVRRRGRDVHRQGPGPDDPARHRRGAAPGRRGSADRDRGAYACTSTTRMRRRRSRCSTRSRGPTGPRAVWNKPLGLVTVLGTPVDVDQVEMLFTSLLIQATRAMAEAGAPPDRVVRPVGLVSAVVPDGVRACGSASG